VRFGGLFHVEDVRDQRLGRFRANGTALVEPAPARRRQGEPDPRQGDARRRRPPRAPADATPP